MLNRIPRNLPTLQMIMDDLQINPRQIARALHITPKTIQRWLKHDKTPYMARVALFWLSSWGFYNLNADLHNKAQIYYSLSQSYKDKITVLQYELDNLSKQKKPLRAANDACFHAVEVTADNT